MKKSILLLVVAAIVLGSAIFWLASSKLTGGFPEILNFIVIAVLIGFALFKGITGLKNVARKTPVEDELSKKIMTKASSISYYISIYLWLGVGYMSDKSKMETHTLIGAGILGMALIFFISWLFVKMKGLSHE